MLIAINYHYIRADFSQPYPSIFGVTPDEFNAHLDRLSKYGQFVSAEDLRQAVANGTSIPERSWLITFDDGLREQFENAWSILQRRGIPAVFFVNTEPISNRKIALVHKIHLLRSRVSPERFRRAIEDQAALLDIALRSVDVSQATSQYKYDTVEAACVKHLLNFSLNLTDRNRIIDSCFCELIDSSEQNICDGLYMSPEQVRVLGEHGCIGTHGHQHVPLGMLSASDISYQIRTSRHKLSQWTGRDIYALSYPYGSLDACSALVGSIAAKEGIQFAFTMERAANPDLDLPLFLARFSSNDLLGEKARLNLPTLFDDVPEASWHRSTRSLRSFCQ